MPVRRYEIIVLRIALRGAPTMMGQLRVVAVDATMILHLRAGETANTPNREPLPVNTAREPLKRRFRQLADVPIIIFRVFDGLNET
jgi:hypothetical protein